MAEYTYEDYLKRQERKANRGNFNGPKVGYFKLENDGDEALVRFIYSSSKEFNLAHVHSVKVGDYYKKVSCLRNVGDPLSVCPVCESGGKLLSRFYVKLLEYTKDENGNIVATPKVWERPESFANTLESYIREYGDLKDHVFKVIRRGQKGSMQTSYDVLFQNPMKYSADNGYTADFSAFDNFDLSHHSYMNKTKEELAELLADAPVTSDQAAAFTTQAPKVSTTVQAAPVYTEPHQPVRPAVQAAPVETPTARPRRTYDANFYDGYTNNNN